MRACWKRFWPISALRAQSGKCARALSSHYMLGTGGRGVRSSRVVGLADDIARSMSAVSARVAPVPGSNVIGIELPNQDPRIGFFARAFIIQRF